MLARRVLSEGGSDQTERLRWALQLVLARPAREEQLATLRQLLETELAGFREDTAAAAKLAASSCLSLQAVAWLLPLDRHTWQLMACGPGLAAA